MKRVSIHNDLTDNSPQARNRKRAEHFVLPSANVLRITDANGNVEYHFPPNHIRARSLAVDHTGQDPEGNIDLQSLFGKPGKVRK